MTRTTHSRRRWALQAALLIPPIALGAFLVWRQLPGTGAPASPSIPGAVTASWSNGKPKVTTRDWTEGSLPFQEICSFSADGSPLGCGTLREKDPWDGIFIDWLNGNQDAEPLAIRRYSKGKRHGTWSTLYPGGGPTIDIEYEHDRMVSRSVRKAEGENVPVADGPSNLPSGAIPLKSAPKARP